MSFFFSFSQYRFACYHGNKTTPKTPHPKPPPFFFCILISFDFSIKIYKKTPHPHFLIRCFHIEFVVDSEFHPFVVVDETWRGDVLATWEVDPYPGVSEV